MFMMKQDKEEPPSTNSAEAETAQSNIQSPSEDNQKSGNGLIDSIKTLFRSKPDSSLRETIEEYIVEDDDDLVSESFSTQEKLLLSNILNLRDKTVVDVMVPRIDIVALQIEATESEVLAILAERQFSRLPVYKDTMDNVVGTVHIKDILSSIAQRKNIDIQSLVREIPIVSPSLNILDLLLQMRLTGKHMVLVIDEFGGVDGLVTIGDIIEAIVGEIDDEHDPEEEPEIKVKNDGSVIADARLDLDEFEEKFNAELSEEEKDENDTLGGLIFTIAGRVPARGEVLTHDSGIVFEILDADRRRVNRVCIRNLPDPSE